MVQFADFKPLREGAAGHPLGLEWLCNEHLQATQALASIKTSEALSKLHDKYGTFPPYESKTYHDPELWFIAAGPNAPKVFAIIRHAAQVSPKEAKKLLANGAFKVAQGWPREFQGWQSALVEAGAQVEIRFP